MKVVGYIVLQGTASWLPVNIGESNPLKSKQRNVCCSNEVIHDVWTAVLDLIVVSRGLPENEARLPEKGRRRGNLEMQLLIFCDSALCLMERCFTHCSGIQHSKFSALLTPNVRAGIGKNTVEVFH